MRWTITGPPMTRGAHVPRDRCIWRGFDFDGECLDAWLTSIRPKTMSLLYMHRGRRIEAVRIGDPDVILPCF